MIRWVLFLSLVPAAWSVSAQEHPFLSFFTVKEGFGTVVLDWEMIAGNTCEGIDILRSLDGVDFVVAGTIPGLCGDIDEPVPYGWTDTDPPELATVHYRLKLGLNGFSSIQSVDLVQLTSEEHRFLPSPMQGEGVLLLRVPASALVDLRISDASGRQVRWSPGLRGGRHPVRLPDAPAGTYFYDAVSDGRRFQGRFVLVR